MSEAQLAEDLSFGAAAIAAHLGLTRRQVYHLAAHAQLPLFRLGSSLCARRSTLTRWIAAREAASTVPRAPGPTVQG